MIRAGSLVLALLVIIIGLAACGTGNVNPAQSPLADEPSAAMRTPTERATPQASVSASPAPSGGSQPFVGSLTDLVAHAAEHLQASVRAWGIVRDVAEGGPFLLLSDRQRSTYVLVLFDTRLYGGRYDLSFQEQRSATVVGTFLPLTAKNIDSVGNRSMAGADVIGFFNGLDPAPSHLIIARRIVQNDGVKFPPAF